MQLTATSGRRQTHVAFVEVIKRLGGRTNPFMKKSASQRDKKPLVKSSREQGATVTTPRSNGSNPAHILGTRRLHDVFTKCIS
jgi:hypothetical protein